MKDCGEGRFSKTMVKDCGEGVVKTYAEGVYVVHLTLSCSLPCVYIVL